MPRRLARWLLLSTVLAALPSRSATGQEGECTPQAMPNVFTTATLHMHLGPANPGPYWILRPSEARRLALLLQYVQQRFAPPPSPDVAMPLPELLLPNVVQGRRVRPPSINAMFSFRAHQDGRVSNIQIARASNAPSLDSALVRALAEAAEQDHIGMLAFTAEEIQRLEPPGWTELELMLSLVADTTRATHPLAAIRLDVYMIEPPFPRPDLPRLEYPADIGIPLAASVPAAFEVDRYGRVDPESVRIDEDIDPRLSRSVREFLRNIRYSPAEVGGCTVRAWMQQRFEFRP